MSDAINGAKSWALETLTLFLTLSSHPYLFQGILPYKFLLPFVFSPFNNNSCKASPPQSLTLPSHLSHCHITAPRYRPHHVIYLLGNHKWLLTKLRAKHISLALKGRHRWPHSLRAHYWTSLMLQTPQTNLSFQSNPMLLPLLLLHPFFSSLRILPHLEIALCRLLVEV